MKRLIDEFDVISEDGQEFHILVYREIINAGTMTDPHATIEGLKSLRTSEGYHCNWIDENNFEIVELGLKVRKV